MARNIIPFELRKGKDDDITRALEKLVSAEQSRSSIIREALRLYLGGQHKQNAPREIVMQPVQDFELQRADKDDDQLDEALNDLLNF